MKKEYIDFLKDIELKFQQEHEKSFPSLVNRIPLVVFTEGRKFAHVKIVDGHRDASGRIVVNNPPTGGSSHAYIEMATGGLIKSTGSQPVKRANGQLGIMFDLSTAAGRKKAYEAADVYGSYLYVK